jgi:hypothetical protein
MLSRYLKHALKQVGRVVPELLISGALIHMYIVGQYLNLPPTLQVIVLKAALVSLGFLHAHITGKVAFPAVMWSKPGGEGGYVPILRIVLYVIFIYAYSHGG